MSHHAREHLEKRLDHVLAVLLLCLTLVSSHEALPPNHQSTPDASTLKIEAKESEASITLGKDLILGPVSAKASIVLPDTNNSDDIASTRLDPVATPATISSRVSSGERGGNASRKPATRDAGSPAGSPVVGSRYWISKGPKTAWRTDSYLEALKHSHTSDDPREGIVRVDSSTGVNRREYVQGPVYKPETGYGYAGSKGPRIAYGGPQASSASDSYSQQSFKPSMDYNDRYGPPQNHYGPPENPYGPPRDDDLSSFYHQSSSQHGSPGNSYPPPQQGTYGPSIHTSVPTAVYGAPYALPDVSHISILPNINLGLPFALKLNAFTIAKIILKLVIFKMIVKFIAAICLLLFIPKLEIIKKKVSNKGEDDEEERSLSSPYASSSALNDLESAVRSSVEKYEAQNGARSNTTAKCTTLVCRITEALTFHESWTDYLSLFKSYVEEERQLAKREEQ